MRHCLQNMRHMPNEPDTHINMQDNVLLTAVGIENDNTIVIHVGSIFI